MSNLPNPAILRVNGDFDKHPLAEGKEYLLTLKGTWDGATIAITTYNTALGMFTAVDGGSWTADAEERLIAPSSKLRFTVSGAGGSTAVGVTLIPIR